MCQMVSRTVRRFILRKEKTGPWLMEKLTEAVREYEEGVADDKIKITTVRFRSNFTNDCQRRPQTGGLVPSIVHPQAVGSGLCNRKTRRVRNAREEWDRRKCVKCGRFTAYRGSISPFVTHIVHNAVMMIRRTSHSTDELGCCKRWREALGSSWNGVVISSVKLRWLRKRRFGGGEV